MSAESCRWVQGSGRFPLNWPGSSALNSSRRQRMVWPLYRTKIEGALLRKGAKQGGTAEVTAFRLWNCRGGGPFVFLPERMFQMKNVQKYARNYFAPPAQQYHWSQREYITQAPRWCSVDLRDGNQALVVPMDLEKKRSFSSFCAGWVFGRSRWASPPHRTPSTSLCAPSSSTTSSPTM